MRPTSMRVALLALTAAMLAPAGAARAGAGQSAAPRPAALEPAASGGLEAVDRALAKLAVHARLLVIGAHPDDEDNALLAWVSRGLGGEAAYLSLSRGEGGQNLIGPELGEPLGLIRTGELLAARQIEGTRQYFTRAYDFGYTRSLDEAFARWPREVLREDAIRVARRFKPQVVVAIFPPDARAGHGQHQASAVIARDVHELAGDPGAFGALELPAWRPLALYRRAWGGEEPTSSFSLGRLEPIGGRSLVQIAAASRSQHRSQDMGRDQPLGEYRGGLISIAGSVGADGGEPFAGLDTRLSALASSLPEGDRRLEIESRLERVATEAERARGALAPVALEEAAASFALILGELRAARETAGVAGEVAAARDLLDEKIAVAEAGLAAAAGVVVDALADRETVVLGESLEVTATLWATGRTPVDLDSVALVSADAWVARAGEAVEGEAARGLRSRRLRVDVPANAACAAPYFLERPRSGDLYDWSGVREEVRGEPLEPCLTARFELSVGGTPVTLEREVVHRYADQAVGEIRRPLRAVPPVEVALEPSLTVWPSGGGPGRLRLDVALASNLDREISGTLRVRLPAGWQPVEPRAVTLAPAGRALTALEIEPPADLEPAAYRIGAEFADAAGGIFAAAYPVFDYPHVRTTSLRVPAVAEVRALSLELPELGRVGYVRGASDRVPELLRKVGLPVELLDLAGAQGTDLGAFDAIVVGSRAYEVDPVLRAANGDLLRYVEEGGTLIVQYQQYQFVSGGYSPLPLEIGRPHGRITDESSPVRILEPDHPVFNRPNAIGASDWDGWVQERGLYFASEWDPAFTPLLALQDPGGEPEQLGSLLIATVGEGTYVYTGLAFFRELPAGVPGAFRLFANLLALGRR